MNPEALNQQMPGESSKVRLCDAGEIQKIAKAVASRVVIIKNVTEEKYAIIVENSNDASKYLLCGGDSANSVAFFPNLSSCIIYAINITGSNRLFFKFG